MSARDLRRLFFSLLTSDVLKYEKSDLEELSVRITFMSGALMLNRLLFGVLATTGVDSKPAASVCKTEELRLCSGIFTFLNVAPRPYVDFTLS